MKKVNSKLRLAPDTLRVLVGSELDRVVGALPTSNKTCSNDPTCSAPPK